MLHGGSVQWQQGQAADRDQDHLEPRPARPDAQLAGRATSRPAGATPGPGCEPRPCHRHERAAPIASLGAGVEEDHVQVRFAEIIQPGPRPDLRGLGDLEVLAAHHQRHAAHGRRHQVDQGRVGRGCLLESSRRWAAGRSPRSRGPGGWRRLPRPARAQQPAAVGQGRIEVGDGWQGRWRAQVAGWLACACKGGDAFGRRAVTVQQLAVTQRLEPLQVATVAPPAPRPAAGAAGLQYFDGLLQPAEPGQGVGSVGGQALSLFQP